MIGRAEDVLSGAIVLLQRNDLGGWIVLFEIKNIPHLRPSPSVDRLVIVADDADILVPLDQPPDEVILDEVGILKFVHHHIATEVLIGAEGFRKAFEKKMDKREEISKIDRVVSPKIFLISPVNQSQPLLKDIELGRHILFRCNPLIL
jgi:hypothetical protein